MNNELLLLLQLAGGTFPSGGFSQSWGFETYVAEKRISDAEGCRKFLITYLDSVIGACEGPILREAIERTGSWDIQALTNLEELSLSMKLTKESRESSLRTGKALLRILTEIKEDSEMTGFYENYKKSGITNAVAFGIVCGRSGIDIAKAMEAYVFSVVSGIVQSAVKLIPLGNTEAQKLLLEMQPYMTECVRKSMDLALVDVTNFSPGFDLAGILHETLPVRLYMS